MPFGVRVASVIDISVELTSGMAVYPGDAALQVRTFGCDATMSELTGLTTHAGTHIDAPAYISDGGTPMSEIPLERFIRPVRVIRCAQPEVSISDFSGLDLPDGTGVLFCTSDRMGGHVSEDAAAAIIDAGIDLVGIDSLSVDELLSEGLPIHKKLLGCGVIIIEHLELQHVAPGSYVLHALPLAVDAPDGAPTRAILTRAIV